MTNMSTPTTVYSVEATFHLQHVNQYNVRISGTNNPHAVFEGTRENTSFNVFLLYLKIHSLSFFFAKRTVTGVVYVDILQEFLMLRRGSHWHSSPVRWSTCCFTLQLRTSWIKCYHENWLAEAGLQVSHLVSPQHTPFGSFFWGYINPAFCVPTLALLCWNLLQGYKLMKLQLHPPCLKMCGMNLKTYMIYTLVLTVPPLNTCWLFSVDHKNLIKGHSRVHIIFIPMPLTSQAILHLNLQHFERSPNIKEICM
jgi:hypothetical protein